MTRCLDCGSERTNDQCPTCGLTSAAAEVVFRKRLLVQMGIFLVGSLAFPTLSQVYPPLDIDAMLVFYGLVFFIAFTLAIVLDRRAHARKEIELLKHLFTGLIPIPFILSVALFLNGKLDSPKNLNYHSTTVEGRYFMHGIVRGTKRVFVYSWREGRRYERLAVDSDDYDRFQVGDKVNVAVQPGALGIPWFYGVYRAPEPKFAAPPPDAKWEADRPTDKSQVKPPPPANPPPGNLQ
jgi:hypothetical protein